MGMRSCLELMANSLQQLHELEQIAASLENIPASQDLQETDGQKSRLEKAIKVLREGLTELDLQQQELTSESEKYRELFEAAPDGYFVTDAKGDITEANRAATLTFSYQAIGQNLANFVHAKSKDQFRRLLGQLQRGQNIKSLDLRMQVGSGQAFEANFTIISIRTPHDGRVVGMRWWIQDITQRKQEFDNMQQSHQGLEIRVVEMNAKLNLMDRQIRLEREEQRRISRNLTRNEAKLRAMMQHSSDIVSILDIDTTIHYCSPALFKSLGHLPEDVIGKKFIKFIHPEDLPIFQSFLTQSVDESLVSTPIVMRYQHTNGDWIYLESVCCNLLQDANVQGLVINSRDITERKRTETALKESESRLAAIASSMPATLYRLAMQPNGRILMPFISYGLIDLIGVSPRQIKNNPYQLLDLIHPEDVDQFKALVKAGFEKLATFRHEFRIIAVTGEVKWAQNITRYYRTEMGMVFADGVCIDISERGEAESSLQRTNELLRAVIKAVPVAIDIISPEGKVLLWNAAAEKLFAWNTAMKVENVVPVIPESQALELQAAILDTLAGKPVNGMKMAFHVREGVWTNVSMSTVLVHNPHGQIIGVLRIIDENCDRSIAIATSSSNNSHAMKSASEDLMLQRADDLIKQYEIGQRNFAGSNFQGAFFEEADLQEVDFSGALLNGSNCNHANLHKAILRGADLRGANFQHADLSGADLRGADLRGADLRGANLTDVITDDSSLVGALLSSPA
jgi:PAS domain S-box-containing protein